MIKRPFSPANAAMEAALMAFASGIVHAVADQAMTCPEFLTPHRLSFNRGYVAAFDQLTGNVGVSVPITRQSFSVITGGKQ
jgi:hypothetical protein